MKRNLPQRIVAIGASSCFGKGDPLGGGFIGRFKEWYENDDESESFFVYNLGIPGDTVGGILKRIKEIEVRRPDLIILQTGCNDCLRKEFRDSPSQTSLSDFKKQLTRLIKRLQKISKVIVVSTYPLDEIRTSPVMWAKHYYLLKDVIEYSNATEVIADKLRVTFIDIMTDWLDKEYNLFLSEDGLHANPNGHEYIFQKLRDRFLNNYSLIL